MAKDILTREGAIATKQNPLDQSVPDLEQSYDFEELREDLRRLSEPGLSRKQAKIIRADIISTMNKRVRAFVAEGVAAELALQSTATLPTSCALPPAGWHCTRAPGHEGPCAAVPVEICADDYSAEQQAIYQHGVEDGKLIARGMERLKAGAVTKPAPLDTQKLPRWIDDLKGKDPTIDGLIECIIEQRSAGMEFDEADRITDALYNRGYRDALKERDQDARGCDEWQTVFDVLTGKHRTD